MKVDPRWDRGYCDCFFCGADDFVAIAEFGSVGLRRRRKGTVGVKNKRLTAGWDEDYLEQVLLG